MAINSVDASSSILQAFFSSSGASSAVGAFVAQFTQGVAAAAFAQPNTFGRASFLNQLQVTALRAQAGARNLTQVSAFSPDTSASTFGLAQVVSNNPTAISGTAEAGAPQRLFFLSVSQIAQQQQVLSNSLSQGGTNISSTTTGAQTVGFTIGGVTKNVSFTINANDTNLTVLNNFTSAVNSAGLGITAAVTNNSSTGNAQLQLTSFLSGTNGAFTLSQSSPVAPNFLSASGTTTASAANTTAGTGGVLQQAQNLAYSINGGASQTSQLNTIQLFNNQVTLNISAATVSASNPTGVTRVNVQGQAGNQSATIADFVSRTNDLLTTLASSPNPAATSSALQSLQIGISRFSALLANVGVTSSAATGLLSVDTNKLSAAIASNPTQVAQVFGNGGLASIVQRAATTALDSTGKVVTNFRGVGTFAPALLQIASSQFRGLLLNTIG